jgi:hypothetical protein
MTTNALSECLTHFTGTKYILTNLMPRLKYRQQDILYNLINDKTLDRAIQNGQSITATLHCSIGDTTQLLNDIEFATVEEKQKADKLAESFQDEINRVH